MAKENKIYLKIGFLSAQSEFIILNQLPKIMA